MKNIQEYWLQGKAILETGVGEWGLPALIVLVGLASFGLGRLSVFEEVKPPVSVGKAAPEAAPRGMYFGGLLVASRAGSVYYYPWCSGAENIAEYNRRFFSSEVEAQRAGYRPSKSCKGLQ